MSEEFENKGNPVQPGEKGSDGNARFSRDPGRDGDRNNRRRNSSGPSDRTDRPSSSGRPAGGQGQNITRSATTSGDRDFQRRDGGYDNRRRGPRPGPVPAQEGVAQSNRAPSSNKHITREIRPEDASANQSSGNRDNRGKTGNQNFDKRTNRSEQRPEKRSGEQKTWSRNIRSEETSEDIRKDNERIEKEIWLEIAGIHTMKLD